MWAWFCHDNQPTVGVGFVGRQVEGTQAAISGPAVCKALLAEPVALAHTAAEGLNRSSSSGGDGTAAAAAHTLDPLAPTPNMRACIPPCAAARLRLHKP